ncbi:MAG: hypothetical protein KC910_01675 [Candidatus Eremiobacteraeota bacterium]|nr:hypothetical protein [Candidatus Eremiobacteraeota bacterium]
MDRLDDYEAKGYFEGLPEGALASVRMARDDYVEIKGDLQALVSKLKGKGPALELLSEFLLHAVDRAVQKAHAEFCCSLEVKNDEVRKLKARIDELESRLAQAGV